MKNPNHKREQRFPFAQRFLTGLIIALALSLTAFEWTTVKTTLNIPKGEFTDNYSPDDEMLPAIKLEQEKIQQLKPKPPQTTPDLLVVDDIPTDAIEPDDVDDNTDDTSTDDNTLNFDDLYAPDDNYSKTDFNKTFIAVELFAHYDECAMLRGQELQACSELSIVNEVKRLFEISEPMKAIGGKQAVHMSFVIDKEGNISNIKTLKTQNQHIAKAAKTAIEKLPQMNPAKQQGKAVALQMQIPIVVRIE